MRKVFQRKTSWHKTLSFKTAYCLQKTWSAFPELELWSINFRQAMELKTCARPGSEGPRTSC